MPLLFLPRRLLRVPSEHALAAALALPSFPRTAVVEGPGPPPAKQRGSVRIEAVTANGLDLRVHGPGALVASSVSHAAAWRAVVGDEAPPRPAPLRPIPVQRVNGAFLGFQAPPGIHRVRLRYLPAGWVAGMGLAAVGLAVFLALIVPTGSDPPSRSAPSFSCRGGQ